MFDSELPRSVLGGFAARVAPYSRRVRLKREAEKKRLGYHLKRRPAPDGEPSDSEGSRPQSGRPEGARQWPSKRAIKGLLGDNSRKPHRARGWESQFRPFEEREAKPNAPRRGYPLAEGDPKGALAGVQRTIRPL